MAMDTVLIGIQARSTSERLPRKAHLKILGKPILQHVIDRAKDAASYLNRYSSGNGFNTDVSLLIPLGDEIKGAFKGHCPIIEGDEKDVLSRYVALQASTECDYIVRITGDCPMIPAFLIQKIIKIGMINGHDYVSNVGDDQETNRTSMDGYDCEFLSSRMLKHLDDHATSAEDREHVTALARREMPDWANYGHVMGQADLSGIKLSVDTLEDYERVTAFMELLKAKAVQSVRKYGKQNVFTF